MGGGASIRPSTKEVTNELDVGYSGNCGPNSGALKYVIKKNIQGRSKITNRTQNKPKKITIKKKLAHQEFKAKATKGQALKQSKAAHESRKKERKNKYAATPNKYCICQLI